MKVCPGWWVVEDECEVRSVCFVSEDLVVRHMDFAIEHTVEDIEGRYGYTFIRLVHLWEVG